MSEHRSEEERVAAKQEAKEKFQSVLFSLLPDEGESTLESLSERTGQTEDEVGKVLSRLSDLGHIEVSDGNYTLKPEIEKDISMLRAMERDSARRKKFDKYRANPYYEAAIEPGSKFDKNQVEAEAGEFQFVRDVSPHERAFCFQNRVYHVWREGPKADEVFLTVDKKLESDVAIVSSDEFLQTIGAYLQEISEGRSGQDLAHLQQYILGTCYGDDSKLGWEQARFYDLNGQGDQINEIMTQMLEKGMSQYLSDFAKEQGIDLPTYKLNFQERDVIPLYYDGLTQNDIRENRWDKEETPIVLKHGTYSHILSNFVQMRGLAARDYYQSFGINKYYGGEGQGKGSYTPHDVSFWYREDGEPIVSGGHGSQRAYDYPMMIGISQEKADKLKLHLGTMDLQMEATVRNFVPAGLISHIFVPSFKVEEIQQLFEQNGIDDIQVLSLRQPEN